MEERNCSDSETNSEIPELDIETDTEEKTFLLSANWETRLVGDQQLFCPPVWFSQSIDILCGLD